MHLLSRRLKLIFKFYNNSFILSALLMAKVIIIGSKTHDPSIHVVAELIENSSDLSVTILDTSELGTNKHLSFSFSENSFEISLNSEVDELFSDACCVWNRRWHNPAIIQTLDSKNNIQGYAQENWSHLINSISLCSNVTWVNHPHRQRIAGHKAYQLKIAHSLGFKIPRTLITSDPEAARAFIGDFSSPVICKSLATLFNAPATRTVLLTRDDLKQIKALTNAPSIFQECIEVERDIRVIVVGSNWFAGEIDTTKGSDPIDWRADFDNPWSKHTLPNSIANSCISIVRELGLHYGAIDLRLTPKGEYIFFEINPGGQFLFLEVWTGLPITNAIAKYLSNHANL
jgi:RimK-like ATP-grasp domain